MDMSGIIMLAMAAILIGIIAGSEYQSRKNTRAGKPEGD